jgi:hypothetical protein
MHKEERSAGCTTFLGLGPGLSRPFRRMTSGAGGGGGLVVELVRTNEIGIIAVLESLLGEADIPYHVADRNMSVLEGSIGAFPMRVLVPETYETEARELLTDADLTAWLRP